MGAHSYLKLGEVLLFAAGYSYITSLAALFRDDELAIQTDEDEGQAYFSRYEYVTPAAHVRDRLDALGYTSQRAAATIAQAHSANPDERTFAEWAGKIWEAIDKPQHDLYGVEIGPDPEWSYALEPPLVLRALLDRCDARLPVALDLAEVINSGYVEADETLCQQAFAEVFPERPLTGPLVVLTEGHSDTMAIQGALEVLRPHLVGFVRFLDHGHRPEGSAAALVRTVRAFAASGISNRIVAVFDNDTAAREALRALDQDALPPNFRVLQLPPIELLSAYPTLGPTGESVLDVNGWAASIEMYFGRDILMTPEGPLTPVQLTAYVAPLARYQGAIQNKRALQAAYSRRLKRARQDGPDPEADWTGMEAVLNAILTGT